MPSKFSKTKCAVKFTKAAAGVIKPDELQQIFDNIDQRKNTDSLEKVIKDVTGAFTDQKSYEAFNQKRTAILNALSRQRMATSIKGWMAKGLSPARAFEAYSLGTSGHPGIGTRNAAEPRRQTLQHVESSRIASQLKKEGLTRYAASGAFDGAIREARYIANASEQEKQNFQPTELPRLKPDDQKAVTRVAELLNNQAEYLRNLARARGAIIAKREAYAGEQYHDTYRIRNAATPGKFKLINKTTEKDHAAYVNDLAKWIDMDKTRNNLVRLGRLGPLESLDSKTFLDRLADIFQGAVRKEPRTGKVSGSGNLAAQAEKARILEFKNPAAQTAYDQKYGRGSLWDNHLAQVQSMAHTITSLDFFGPSASDNFDKVFHDMGVSLGERKQAVRNDAALSGTQKSTQLDKIQKQIDSLNQSSARPYLDRYLGLNREPGNMTQARLVDNVMALERVALLGGSFFSSIPTFATSTLQADYAGVPLLQAAFRALFGVLERAGKDDLQTWCRQTGVGTTGMMEQFASHLMEGYDGTPGKMIGNMQSKFFNLVGLTPLKDMVASNYVFMTSNEMAHNAGKDFDHLPVNMARHLSDYEISPQEWDIIRSHAVTKVSGYDMLASDKIREAPQELFPGATRSSQVTARINLEMKLANLFRDSADYATVEPDLKTRQLTPFVNGTHGTINGDIGRLTMQFSTWAFAHGSKVIQRQFMSQSFPSFLAKVAGGLTLTGILSYTARQLAQGKNPMANPNLWQTDDKIKLAQAWGTLTQIGAVQSGVGGMFGDLFFSQNYDNGRGGPLQMLGGPAADDIEQLIQFSYDGLLKGKFDGSQIAKFAQGNTPFVNTWWIKPVINYLLMYGIEDSLNPGVLKRMEKMSAKAGDPYYLPPTQYANKTIGQALTGQN